MERSSFKLTPEPWKRQECHGTEYFKKVNHPLALDPPDLSEGKGCVKADTALQGDVRQLTLEEEVQRRCEEKSPSEATEDPSPGGLHADPTDSKTLQGTALGVEGPLSRHRRLTCAALLLTRPRGGRETALALVREVPSALLSHLGVFPT